MSHDQDDPPGNPGHAHRCRSRHPRLAAACGSSAGGSGSGSGPISSSSASADSAQALDPCTLLDESTIESTVGLDVTQDGSASNELRGRSCRWNPADPQVADAGGKLVITTFHGSAFYLDGTIGDPVPGIGDEAQGNPNGGVILFRKGEEVVEVEVLIPGHFDAVGPLATAAAAAVKAS